MQQSAPAGLNAADLNFNPPQFPQQALADALQQHYGISGSLHALDGERDQNHRVDCADGRQFVFKVSSPGEAPGAVDFQIGALQHLEASAPELAVPRLIPSLEGNTREWIEDDAGVRHMIRLLSWLPGEPLSSGSALEPSMFRSAADFQARLAQGLRGYFHPHARHFVAWDIQRALVLDPGVQARVQPDALALAAGFLQRLEQEVLPRLPALRAQVVHSDGHTGNLLRPTAASQLVNGVIDFGDMVHAPLVQDLAVMIASFLRYGGMRFENALAQLESYNRVMPLGDADLELLHDMVLLRIVTALFMYDFRAATTENPPAWIAEERPDIVTALQLWLAIDQADALAQYRMACGRAAPRVSAPSKELRARREKVLGPSYRLFYDEPVQLVRGEGVWLWDAEGRRYLDGYNNVASVGHCHPHVVAALASQAATLNTHTRYLHENVVRYAERLTATMPAELSVCLLVCTGTEANDLAIRIARTVSGHEGVIVSEESYHGNSNVVGAASTCMYPAADQPAWLATVEAPNGFRGSYRYGTPQLGELYAAQLDGAIGKLRSRGHGTATFMCDTIWDSNGTILPPPGYLERAAAATRAAGGLFIADEVQAGFYRTGEQLWSFNYAEVVPDIVTIGKPAGAGHPLGAVITTPAIAAAFAKTYSYFNTFGGNPVSAAVGNAVLDVLERENVQQNVIASGAVLEPGLQALRARFPFVADVRGKGLFWGLEIVKDAGSIEPDVARADRIINLLREDGCLLGRTGAFNNVVKIRPPLVFSPEHAGILLEKLGRALAAS